MEQLNNINDSEQWKLHGDCSKCRREAHCQKKCTARKHKTDLLSTAYSSALLGAAMHMMFPTKY